MPRRGLATITLALLTTGSLALLADAAPGQPCPEFTGPLPLNNNADTDLGYDWFPQVTTDRAGNWVGVWHSGDTLGGSIGTDADILVARSSDNGVTWTDPEPLNNNAGTDSGSDLVPQVTTDGGGNWVAVWYSGDRLGGTIGTDYDILVARSSNNGATWTDPEPLNNNAGADSGNDWTPQVTTDGAGNWVAVWTSSDDLGGTIGNDFDTLMARSSDKGATWTDPEPLNNNADTDSGNDWTPQVTTDGGGNWVAVWESRDDLGGTIGTDSDILVARSSDNGVTWTDPEPLNNNAETDSGSDWAPQVTTDAAGNWVGVWQSWDTLGATIGTDYDILVARSSDNGVTWTDPEPLNNNADADSEHDVSPQVTIDGGGNWVAVWNSLDDLGGTIGTDPDILVARSGDNGVTWTDPEPLNNNATTDSGWDRRPQVTTDGAGNWVAVWASRVNLGGTIGADWDILVARFVLTAADCNSNGTPDECDIAGGTSADGNTNGVPDECEAQVLHLDIKPGSCPNALNRTSHGVLPVSLLGTADFDVNTVDLSSVRISRADGVGGVAAPNEGPPGPHTEIEDAGTPFGGELCDCHELGGDGIDDLSMKFNTDDIVEALELGDLPAGALVELVASGTLADGSEFIASDCVRLVPPGTPPGKVINLSDPAAPSDGEASPAQGEAADGTAPNSFEGALCGASVAMGLLAMGALLTFIKVSRMLVLRLR